MFYTTFEAIHFLRFYLFQGKPFTDWKTHARQKQISPQTNQKRGKAYTFEERIPSFINQEAVEAHTV